MNTLPKEIKKKYLSPKLVVIKLDNEISLQLESSPPFGPNESDNIQRNSEYFKLNPYEGYTV